MKSFLNHLFCTVLFAGAFTFSYAQQPADSLLQALKAARQDTQKVKLLNLLSKNLTYDDPVQSYTYARQANLLALKNKYVPGMATSYCNLGMYYLNKKNHDSARACFNEGLAITRDNRYKSIHADLLKRKGVLYYYSGLTDSALVFFKNSLTAYEGLKDSLETVKLLNNIGTISFRNGDLDGAVFYFLKCLRFDEKKNDVPAIAIDCNNLGSVLTTKMDFKSAEAYLKRALDIRIKLNDPVLLANTHMNLGTLYHDTKKHEAARTQFAEALKLLDKEKQPFDYAMTVNNLGLSYVNTGDNDKAYPYLIEALAIKTRIGDKSGLASTLSNLGAVCYTKKDYDKAQSYYLQARQVAIETGNLSVQVSALLQLHYCYVYKRQTEKAIETMAQYVTLRDSMYNTNSSKQIAEMQTRYETDKKIQENEELRRKTQIQQLMLTNEGQKRKIQLTVVFLIVLLVGGTTLFLYNRRRQQQKVQHAQELAEADKLRFKEVMEAEENERSRIARELHDGLGQLLSTARLNVAGLEDAVPSDDKPDLDRSLKIIDDACVEVRNISHNMMPNALIRLGLIPAIQEVVTQVNSAKKLRINFETNVDTSLGQSLDITIYRIVQEILNNMIRHSQANEINMSIQKEGGQLEISIRDNGIGFDTEKLNESKGMGWKNIFSRVSLLDGDMKLESELQKGTVVYIRLALKHG